MVSMACRVPVGWVLGEGQLPHVTKAGWFKTSFRWLPVKCQPSLLGVGGAQWDAQLPGSTHTQLVPLG